MSEQPMQTTQYPQDQDQTELVAEQQGEAVAPPVTQEDVPTAGQAREGSGGSEGSGDSAPSGGMGGTSTPAGRGTTGATATNDEGVGAGAGEGPDWGGAGQQKAEAEDMAHGTEPPD